MLLNFNGHVNLSMIYDKYMEYSRKNYLDKMIELGLEKKNVNTKLDQNEEGVDEAEEG